MSTGTQDAGSGFTQSVGGSASRGIAVILSAVAVGAVLMWFGYSDQSVDAAADGNLQVEAGEGAGDDAASADGAADGTTDGAGVDVTSSTTSPTTVPTTEATPLARPPAEVKVLVLNAAVNKRGIAGRGTAIVDEAGYTSLKAGDANRDQETEIQYAAGYEADAAAIADVFGLDSSVVVPIPDAVNTDDASDANVIVIIGLDGKIDI